jgi:hypothetical protein
VPVHERHSRSIRSGLSSSPAICARASSAGSARRRGTAYVLALAGAAGVAGLATCQSIFSVVRLEGPRGVTG